MTTEKDSPPLANFYEGRAGVYREFGNGSLLGVVRSVLPPGGRLLDVGCASGGLLAGVRDRASYAVGIELSLSAAAEAEAHADAVVVGDVADPGLDIGATDFDVVVLADVVEHVIEPLPVLQRSATWCSPSGCVVISIPNIAHWKARLAVARGRWEYAESGTFDTGHLRFFTRSSIVQLVTDAGLDVEHLVPVVPALRNHLPGISRLPTGARKRIEAAWQRLGSRFPELLGYQLLVVVTPRHASHRPAAA